MIDPIIEEVQVPQTDTQIPTPARTDFQYAPGHPLYGTYYGTSLTNFETTRPITVLSHKRKRLHRLI